MAAALDRRDALGMIPGHGIVGADILHGAPVLARPQVEAGSFGARSADGLTIAGNMQGSQRAPAILFVHGLQALFVKIDLPLDIEHRLLAVREGSRFIYVRGEADLGQEGQLRPTNHRPVHVARPPRRPEHADRPMIRDRRPAEDRQHHVGGRRDAADPGHGPRERAERDIDQGTWRIGIIGGTGDEAADDGPADLLTAFRLRSRPERRRDA